MMEDNYKDIVNIEHFEPVHARMSRTQRAAQFAPFAALEGYSELVKETARLIEKEKIIDDSIKEEISKTLNIIKENIKSKPLVKIEYFEDDKKKIGGKYIEIENRISKIDEIKMIIKMEDNQIIKINKIIKIEVNNDII